MKRLLASNTKRLLALKMKRLLASNMKRLLASNMKRLLASHKAIKRVKHSRDYSITRRKVRWLLERTGKRIAPTSEETM
jgi:hypothetical protein